MVKGIYGVRIKFPYVKAKQYKLAYIGAILYGKRLDRYLYIVIKFKWITAFPAKFVCVYVFDFVFLMKYVLDTFVSW